MSAAGELNNINLITTPVDILISCPENKRLIISPDCSPAHTLSTWIFITKIPQICLCMCCYGNSNHVFSEDWVLMFIINQTRSVASVEVAQWWSGVACHSYSATSTSAALADWLVPLPKFHSKQVEHHHNQTISKYNTAQDNESLQLWETCDRCDDTSCVVSWGFTCQHRKLFCSHSLRCADHQHWLNNCKEICLWRRGASWQLLLVVET